MSVKENMTLQLLSSITKIKQYAICVASIIDGLLLVISLDNFLHLVNHVKKFDLLLLKLITRQLASYIFSSYNK